MANKNTKATASAVADAVKNVNVNKSKKTKKTYKVIVTPVDSMDFDESFAIANGVKIPFETPVEISEDMYKALVRQKIPYKSPKRLNVQEVMDRFKVKQEVAWEIIKNTENNQMNEEIKWRQRYNVRSL